MKLTRLIAIGVIAGSIGIHAAGANTLRQIEEPAERPPASFQGKQYVDSRGCVFIRAGIDGHVSWVPRVSRDRKVICGFKPTLAGGAAPGAAPAAQTVQAQAPAQQPVQITLSNGPTPVQVSAPAPAVRSAPAVRPAPQPVQVVQRPVAPTVPVAPKPQVLIIPIKPDQPAAAPAPQRVAENVYSCAGFTGVSGALMKHSDYPVRCGPQDMSPTTFVGRYNDRLAPSPGPVVNSQTMNLQGSAQYPRRFGPQEDSPTTFQGRYNDRLPPSPGPLNYLESMATPRVQVQQRQVATTYRSGYTPPQPQVISVQPQAVSATHVPAGYRPAWKDDRLNPNRGQGTQAGQMQMDLVWTNTIPRQLIDRKTGQDVTRMFPQLTYPNTAVTVISYKNRPAAVQPDPQVSSRSAPAPSPQLKRDVIRASVQVGIYRDRNAAQNIARSVQRLGLPVRIGVMNRGGEELRIVVAGPFGSEDGLNAALGRVRGAGYANAVIRR